MSKPAEPPHFACPTCEVGLRRLSGRPRDLFCRGCGTAVALMEGDAGFFLRLGDSPASGRVTLARLPLPPAES